MIFQAGSFLLGLSLAVAPRPGVFLVAKPKIDSGPFRHSVVLLVSHGDQGTLGLIINRATDLDLTKALPDLEAEGASTHSIHFGGPVGLDGLLFLFTADEPPDDVENVMANVYFSGDRKLLEKLVERKETEDRLKLYLGHAGWAPGQLAFEIARGDWDLVPADAFTVFRKAPQGIWPELSRQGTTVASAFKAGSGRPFRPSSRTELAEAR